MASISTVGVIPKNFAISAKSENEKSLYTNRHGGIIITQTNSSRSINGTKHHCVFTGAQAIMETYSI